MRRNALFWIDPDEVEARLRTVNAPLLDQAAALLVQARDTWRTEDTARLRRAVARLSGLLKEIQRTRLSDTAPLRKAASAGKRVFGATESSLKQARSALHAKLSDLELPVILLRSPALAEPDTPPFQTSGEPDAEIDIESFDRNVLPLEALRPYLSDHALRSALAKHLADHGPTLGPAVRYRALARI